MYKTEEREAFLGFYDYWRDEKTIPACRKIAQDFFEKDNR